nr:ABC transporter permease [Paenibacillus turpanensis]
MFSKKSSLFVFFMIPVLLICLLIALANKEETVRLPVIYVSEDRGELGSELISALEKNPNLLLVQTQSVKEAAKELQDGRAEAVFLIPHGFTDALWSGSAPQVMLQEKQLTEQSFIIRTALEKELRTMEVVVSAINNSGKSGNERSLAYASAAEQIAEKQIRGRIEAVTVEAGQWKTLPIGILMLFIMALANMTVSIYMEDRGARTMERIFTAPVRGISIALGNFLGILAVGTVQILLVLCIAKLGFSESFLYPFWPLFLLLEFFLLASIGLSTSVASLIRSKRTSAIMNSVVITPTCMLGGCFWPLEIMPEMMQKIANFVPQKWVIDGVGMLLLDGKVLDLGYHFAILLLFAVVLLGFGSAVLRPSDSSTA